MGETLQLAEFAARLRLEDCPARVVAQAKRCITETLGCALGGARTPLTRAAVQAARRQGEGGCATAIGLGFRTAPDRAAFINGISANALDFDGGIIRQGHYGPTAVCSALAAGELAQASGRQFLEATIVAYEVVSRVGRAIRASAEQSRLVSGYGPHQGFAAVSAAGHLLGLDTDRMVHAFGLYGAFAPVPSTKQWNWDNRPLSWTKDMVAWPSMAGINAALLAESGFLGPRTIFEGEKGFFRMAGSDRYSPETLVAGLGTEFNILHMYFKPYPCCRWNHAALDGVGEILERRGWSESDVREIRIGVAREVMGDLGDYDPDNLVDCEFSMPYAVALRMLGMKPGPGWHDPSNLESPRVRDAMKKVVLQHDEDMERFFSERHSVGAVVRVEGTNGTVETTRVECALGDEELPMSDGDLEAKFLTLAAETIPDASAEAAVRMIRELENTERLADLSALLAG
ncbi:MAG: MmgE/PrpD family protein [Syntrophobacteraceae bacterium]